VLDRFNTYILRYKKIIGTNVPLIGISFAVFHIMGKTGMDVGEIGIYIRWYK
jgi:hypothetical protein